MNKLELDILTHVDGNSRVTQRQLAERLRLSPAYVNKLMQGMRDKGWLGGNARDVDILPPGREAMEECRVDNAVILAAGVGSRFVPLAYDKPKGLISVRGEPMVERMVRQLQQSGIDDITICVGYLKEQYEYMIDDYGVKLLVINDYRQRNSLSTLQQAASLLGNSYVLASDYYMEQNPFSRYECQNWYGSADTDVISPEWYIRADTRGRIRGISIGGEEGTIMLGPAYFTRECSDTLRPMLDAAAADPRYDSSPWEHILMRNISRLPELYTRDMSGIYKLSSLESLREFDPSYMDKSQDRAMQIIAGQFNVSERDITEIYPMKEGMTNTSFLFCVGGSRYIFRNPGAGSNELVNRMQEYACYQAIEGSGIADEPIYMDVETGVKITPYFENSRILNADDPAEMATAMDILRKLHSGRYTVEHDFNPAGMMRGYEALMRRDGVYPRYTDYHKMRHACDKLQDDIAALNPPRIMCHNDANHENYLVLENGDIKLIDWEYAGMCDPINDIAMHSLYRYCGMHQSTDNLHLYLGRKPNDDELLRLYGWMALGGMLWAIWTIYKEGLGENFGDYGMVNYRLCKKFLRAANALLAKRSGDPNWQEELDAAARMTGLNKAL